MNGGGARGGTTTTIYNNEIKRSVACDQINNFQDVFW